MKYPTILLNGMRDEVIQKERPFKSDKCSQRDKKKGPTHEIFFFTNRVYYIFIMLGNNFYVLEHKALFYKASCSHSK